MQKSVRRLFVWLVLVAFVFASEAQAAAIVESVTGDVKAGPSTNNLSAVAKDQKLDAGVTIVTGPKSVAVLGFDDGQKMVLAENTEFRITGYSFHKDEPKKDHFAFALLKGALRSITSLFTRRNPNAYALRIPQATIGIRGTDYMVALVNPAYLHVLGGNIGITTGAGFGSFGPPSYIQILGPNALPVTLPAVQLPPNVAQLFKQLAAFQITPGAAGVNAATIGAAGGPNPAWFIVPLVIGGALAGSGGGGGNNNTGTTK